MEKLEDACVSGHINVFRKTFLSLRRQARMSMTVYL